MTELLPVRLATSFARALCVCLVLLVCTLAVSAQTAPVLLTEGTGSTTRAVAYESVSRRSEPFSITSPIAWTSDTRTRIMLFAMNLHLLAGEGVGALTADAEDANGKRYPLKVEYVGFPPYTEFDVPNFQYKNVPQGWLFAVVLRLSDEMTDTTGDVLVRISLHGVSSNRVRVAIGQAGGGPPTDTVAEVISPAPAATPTPMPPLTPKAYVGGEATTADVTRLLEQGSWGPNDTEVPRVQTMGLRAYLNEQFNAPATNYPDLAFPFDDSAAQCPSSLGTQGQADCLRDNYSLFPVQKSFFTGAMYGQSQLRHRVAFALHQILVVSGRDGLAVPSWFTKYLQVLDRNALGNFRTLLGEMTLNPSMGEYLDMRVSTRTNPNENWAREVLQLFSIGTNELNLDGTVKLDAQGVPIPTYTQTHVNEFTRAFTGWNLNRTPIAAGITNWRDPMTPRAGNNHDAASKTLLNGLVVPTCGTPNTNQQCAQSDLNIALDNIFNHPNVGPFIGKQLIQHLVTSNPTPAYVERVSRVFNNDCDALYADGCTSARGNLRAVVQAILLDPEARGNFKNDPSYGKLREPVQYMSNIVRAFNAKSANLAQQSDGVLAGRASGGDYTALMDQQIYQPATVFSYYPPDYEVPGTKLLGPAFNILSTSTALRRANFVNQIVYTGIPASVPPGTDRPQGTALDLSPLTALANDPAALVARLDALLLHGTMSSSMRTTVTNAVAGIPTSDANFQRKRAQLAIYLMATSSQYQVQR